jgi:hypothetical protein
MANPACFEDQGSAAAAATAAAAVDAGSAV